MKNLNRVLVIGAILVFAASTVSAETCSAIKGLVSSKSSTLKYYLMPSHPLHPIIQTLYPERGEMCFADEQDALDAGFFKLPNPGASAMTRIQATPTPIVIVKATPTPRTRIRETQQSCSVIAGEPEAAISEKYLAIETRFVNNDETISYDEIEDLYGEGKLFQLIEPYVTVTIVKSRSTSDAVEIRHPDYPNTIWVRKEAINCK